MIPDAHVTAVCCPGKANCCRYLCADRDGWRCAKLNELRPVIDARVLAGGFRAVGDNCEGVSEPAMVPA